MRVVNIVGTRPQFIKATLVSRKLRERNIEELLVHTGQHYDFKMSSIFFKELHLPQPDYYLGIEAKSHGEQTGKMLIEIEKILLKERPDLVIVYGDTNSTLAGALAASKLSIPIAHVEAGLRSYNKRMPEEINRVLTDHISDILFAPTHIALENLKKEGIIKNVYKVGDIMFDIALESIKKVNESKILEKFALKPKNFVLVTIHRAENTDYKENLLEISEALKELSKRGIKLLFPIHPRTKKALVKFGIDLTANTLLKVEPVSYFEMLALEKNAKVIITDSGGVQKEGYFWGTPCIIPRTETEWIELVNIGFNVLTGANKRRIVQETLRAYFSERKVEMKNFYGDGKAADRIVEVISRR